MLDRGGDDLDTPHPRRKSRADKTSAFMFARVTRDANEIAAALGVSKRTVERMIHLPEFQEGVGPTRLSGRATFSQSTTSTAR